MEWIWPPIFYILNTPLIVLSDSLLHNECLSKGNRSLLQCKATFLRWIGSQKKSKLLFNNNLQYILKNPHIEGDGCINIFLPSGTWTSYYISHRSKSPLFPNTQFSSNILSPVYRFLQLFFSSIFYLNNNDSQ
jgi:hypothetical protein